MAKNNLLMIGLIGFGLYSFISRKDKTSTVSLQTVESNSLNLEKMPKVNDVYLDTKNDLISRGFKEMGVWNGEPYFTKELKPEVFETISLNRKTGNILWDEITGGYGKEHLSYFEWKSQQITNQAQADFKANKLSQELQMSLTPTFAYSPFNIGL